MNYNLKNSLKAVIPAAAKAACISIIVVALCTSLASAPTQSMPETATEQTPAPTSVPTSDPTVACGSFINPTVGVISSHFGVRDGRMHTGLDVAGDMGTDIVAADAGVIEFSGEMNGYGNYIIIDHENGYKTAYAHCDELLAVEGVRVKQGDVIAKMGSTGRSTGPHLHFEIKVNDEFCDPLEYVMY